MTESDSAIKQGIPIELEIPEELEAGVYVNYMQVNFTQWEFTITFGRIVPEKIADGKAKAKAVSRIVIPHLLMPQIIDALVANLNRLREKMQEETKQAAQATEK